MAEGRIKRVAADDHCFVCGADNPIGLQAAFQTDVASRTSFAELTLAEHYQGWQQLTHGGIIAALLDEACIYACRSLADECVTAELKIRYRKPVPVGTQIEVRGRLLDSSKKIWSATAELMIAGVVHAEATARVYNLDKPAAG